MPNHYDRIIKEIFQRPTISLINRIIGEHQLEVIPMPTELHKTMEKKVDMLFKAYPAKGPPFLLLIEWQTWNDKRMVIRMLLYYSLLKTHYPALEIRAFVIYIGKEVMRMKDDLEEYNLQFKYELIDLSKHSSDTFLLSNIPEEVILAILADGTQKEDKRATVQNVLIKLCKLLKDDPATLSERLIQLEVLGKLRNIQSLIIEEGNNMSHHYNVKTDIRYKQGEAIGIEKGIKKGRIAKDTTVVRNLLRRDIYDLQEIADIADVSLRFVQSIKSGMTE